ncbi:hypothetical protein GCM10010331_69200 [Streptomyces xanthochromogenes]|uniref:hypothetical protein n=1 Tax=Streptomyces xanthochromogenes TaxID=67384 RepID=UPI0016737A17|nr:hypothetical protein [Streptomyces xanthochromogenes]GHB71458.1 hypothetical protein GCM10010331_69200 [Streptomyces xanthochromogenes]
MTGNEWDRSRSRAHIVGTLAVVAVLAAVITVFAIAGVPDAWWPQICSVSAASPQPTSSNDPCVLITGLAHDSCAPTPAPFASGSSARPSGAGTADAFRLAVPAAGLLLVYAVRRSGRRRR